MAGNREQMRAMEHELLVNQSQVRELQMKMGDQEGRIDVLQRNVTDLKYARAPCSLPCCVCVCVCAGRRS